MAFVAEDGTGLADANALCSVAFADAYFADRSITAWTGSNTVKEGALIRATDYIETVFGRRFKGCRETDTQALSFPRVDLVPDVTGVPVEVSKACSEYALRALAGPLAPDPVVDETGLAVVAKKEVVGPIEESTTYETAGPGSAPALLRPYPAADMLLAKYVKSRGGVIRA